MTFSQMQRLLNMLRIPLFTTQYKDATTAHISTRDHCIALLHSSIEDLAMEVLAWSNTNSMSLSVTKTKSMFISLRDNISLNRHIVLNDTEIENIDVF